MAGSKRKIRARKDREMEVDQIGGESPYRIDESDERAPRFRVPQKRHEVDVGGPRIRPPNQDELGLGVVRKGDSRHLPVHALRDFGGGRGADRLSEPGGSKAGEVGAVNEVVAQESVRAAVVVGEDRLAAFGIPDLAESFGDGLEGGVPIDALETSLALRVFLTEASHGVEKPIGMVQPVREPTHLGADEIPGDVVSGPGSDLRDPSLFDRDFE